MTFNKKWHRNAVTFWKKIIETYHVEDELLSVLHVACQSLDIYSRGMDALMADGITYIDEKGTIRNHPANEVCSKSINGFLRAIRMLGITSDFDETAAIGKPKGGNKK